MGQCTLYYPGTQYIYVRIYQVTLLAVFMSTCFLRDVKAQS